MAKVLIGYQVQSTDGDHNIPDQFYSFEVLSKEVAEFFMDKEAEPNYWEIVPIYEGDIEVPSFLTMRDQRI